MHGVPPRRATIGVTRRTGVPPLQLTRGVDSFRHRRGRRNRDIEVSPSPSVGFGPDDVGDRSIERRTDQQRAQVPTRGNQAGCELSHDFLFHPESRMQSLVT